MDSVSVCPLRLATGTHHRRKPATGSTQLTRKVPVPSAKSVCPLGGSPSGRLGNGLKSQSRITGQGTDPNRGQVQGSDIRFRFHDDPAAAVKLDEISVVQPGCEAFNRNNGWNPHFARHDRRMRQQAAPFDQKAGCGWK